MRESPTFSRARASFVRLAAVLVGLFLFVLALELLKKGAGGIGPLLRHLGVSGFSGGLGVGWLAACILLSGSPVAAMALTFLASGTLSTEETFGMIAGSRLGASFVVLVIGVLDDLRARREENRSAYIGVAALLATAVVYLPAMGLSWLGLHRGVFTGLRLEGRELAGLFELVYGPFLAFLTAHLPRLLLFVAGVLVLLTAFRAFDRALPDLENRETPLLDTGHVFYRPWFMFGVGLLTTALTLSVSVSLSLLVPLAAKGYVRRENVCPYILGANITTFIDTLFAGALVGHPDGLRVVALLTASVSLLSLPIVFLFPFAFGHFVDRLAVRATAGPRAVFVFVAFLFLIPLALIAL
jgi:solute carrier family 34 (sodium-dependent phosphate cotransporter)